MSEWFLPTLSDPLYTIRFPLDDEDWIFKLDWNDRAQHWLLAIGRAVDGTPDQVAWSVNGIVIVCQCDLLARYNQRRDVPRGILIALAKGSDDSPPRLDDFGDGKRVTLHFIDRPEALTIVNAPSKAIFQEA